MNRMLGFILAFTVLCMIGVYLLTPVMLVRVADEDGMPVANTKIKVEWSTFPLLNLLPRHWNDPGHVHTREGQTDEKGEFKFFGIGKHLISVSANGYYATTSDDPGKIVLRKRNPVPMYAKRAWFYLPAGNGEFGYDLFEGDLVAPYGVGKNSDFIFAVSPTNTPLRKTKTVTIDLIFSGPNDGIQPLFMPLGANILPRSGYPLPFIAPESGYFPSLSAANGNTQLLYREYARQPQIRKANGRSPSPWYRDDSKLPSLWYWKSSYRLTIPRDRVWMEEVNYFFKVRSDTNGHACYGIIEGLIRLESSGKPTVEFKYFVNPSGTRSVEFDPNQNLMKRLGRNPPESKVLVPL